MGLESNGNSSSVEERGRKSSKPLMEKRRRARINQSLNELKTLILEAMKKDTSCYSKLEKADILEMTVRYLRSLKNQQLTAAVSTDPGAIAQYRAGFNECATEITRYLMGTEGLDVQIKARILSHLSSFCRPRNLLPLRSDSITVAQQPFALPLGQHSILQASTSTTTKHIETLPSMANQAQFQIVPGHLANGKIAAVLVPSQRSIVVASPQLIPVFSQPTVDFQPLQGFQFNSPVARHEGESVWRPW